MPPKPTRSRIKDAAPRLPPRVPDYDEEVIPTSIYSPEEPSKSASRAGAKPAFLYVERGPGAGQLLPLREGTLVVGRASISDLRLQHASISRRHAQFTRRGDRIFVRDLGSQNGTFVNKTKIATEIEVQMGDQIAVGNAVLLLKERHTPAVADVPEEPDAGSGSRSVYARRGRKLWRVSVVAGAAGFGLAGLLMFGLVKMANEPTEEELAAADKHPVPATLPTPQPVVKQEKALEKREEKRAAEAELKERAEKPRTTERSRDTFSEKKTSPEGVSRTGKSSKASALASKLDEEFEVRGSGSKATSDEPESSGTKAKRGGGSILAKYKDGDVAAAIEMAEEEDDSEMSDKLIKFERLYKDAQAALGGRDGVVAIRSLSAAVRQDDLISKGKGRYAEELRQKLAELYTMVGKKHLESFKRDEAQKAFQAALKYDPKNSEAAAELKRLSGGIEVRVDGDSDPSSDSSVDETEEAPPPRRKARSKSTAKASSGSGSAIDDAFGD